MRPRTRYLAQAVLVVAVGAMAMGLRGGLFEPKCVYIHAHFAIDIMFSNGTPNESQWQAFVQQVKEGSNWSTSGQQFTTYSGTAHGEVDFEAPPRAGLGLNHGKLDIWAREGSSTDATRIFRSRLAL